MKDVFLKPGERIDDLQRNGCRIIQDPGRFCFGMDAVLLAGFATCRPRDRVCDLGTGTGILPILLAARHPEAGPMEAVEIQEESADMARRSVEMNEMEGRITVRTGDLKEASRIFGSDVFDLVVSNPPYMPGGRGLTNPSEPLRRARHEIDCTFEDVAREAARILRERGRFALVHRPERLAGIIGTMLHYRLEPKRMKLVHPYAGQPANMVLIEAVKGGGEELKVEAPLIIYREAGVYTDEIYDIYGY